MRARIAEQSLLFYRNKPDTGASVAVGASRLCTALHLPASALAEFGRLLGRSSSRRKTVVYDEPDMRPVTAAECADRDGCSIENFCGSDGVETNRKRFFGILLFVRGSMKVPLHYVLLCILLFIGGEKLSAQLALDTARGEVGERVQVPFVFSAPVEHLVVRGQVQLSNPTVFYPEGFWSAQSGSNLFSRMTRLTDSTYTFELEMSGASAGVVCYLSGEALAGSDSICTIRLSALEANGEPWPDTTGVVVVTSIGTPLPYARFARLEQNYPNPVARGLATTWAYRIDKQSAIRFVLYDMDGKTLEDFDLGERGKGIHVFSFTPPVSMATGLYWARLVTNSGEFAQPFVVVP